MNVCYGWTMVARYPRSTLALRQHNSAQVTVVILMTILVVARGEIRKKRHVIQAPLLRSPNRPRPPPSVLLELRSWPEPASYAPPPPQLPAPPPPASDTEDGVYGFAMEVYAARQWAELSAAAAAAAAAASTQEK